MMGLRATYVKFVRWFWKGLEGKLNYQTGFICLVFFSLGFIGGRI